MSFFVRLLKDRVGATVVEYGLLASLISIAIILGLTSIGSSINATFDTVTKTLVGAQKSGKQ